MKQHLRPILLLGSLVALVFIATCANVVLALVSAPTITSITSVSADRNSPVTLVIKGANFSAAASVELAYKNGASHYVLNPFVIPPSSPTEIKISIPVFALDTAGLYELDVVNTDPDYTKHYSNEKEFIVGGSNPVPVITGISPSVVTADSDPFVAVTISGKNFLNGSFVKMSDGASVSPTPPVSSSQMTVWLPRKAAGSRMIAVVNPAPGGGTSGALAFTFKSAGASQSGLAVSQGVLPGAPLKTLILGSSGDDVKTLQQALIAAGERIPAGPTGFFGSQTKAALVSYQNKNGIPAIGIADPKTLAKLKGLASGSGGGSSIASSQNTTQPTSDKVAIAPTTSVIPPATDAKTQDVNSQTPPLVFLGTGGGSSGGGGASQSDSSGQSNSNTSTLLPDTGKTSSIVILLDKGRDSFVVGDNVTFTVYESNFAKAPSLTYTLTDSFGKTSSITNNNIFPNGVFNWQAMADDVGTHVITVTAKDSDGNSAETQVTITVTEPSDKSLFDISILPMFTGSGSGSIFIVLGLFLVIAAAVFVIYWMFRRKAYRKFKKK